MNYFERTTKEEDKKYLLKLLKRAKKEDWVEVINDILLLAEKKGIKL